MFYVFADIFRSRDMGGGAKTVWCIVIIIVPFLGVFIYLIARGGGMTERSLAQQQQMQQQQAEFASAKKLLDAGTITQAEFDQMKAKALASS